MTVYRAAKLCPYSFKAVSAFIPGGGGREEMKPPKTHQTGTGCQECKFASKLGWASGIGRRQ